MVELISCSDYFSKVRLVEGAVDYVFFMHQSSISMCQTFSTVFCHNPSFGLVTKA